MQKWSPNTWRHYTSTQLPSYENDKNLGSVLEDLSFLPPLVTTPEIKRLKMQIAEAMQNKRFVLQGGDCAESFSDCRASTIENKIKILLQMSEVLTDGMKKPITRVGRIAGQYAKPRSVPMETQEGLSLPSYRGDIYNRPEFNTLSRQLDPFNLIKGYYHAASTINYIRAFLSNVEFYTSHEALNLYYESALTRQTPEGTWYNFGTHFPWVGVRTAVLDSPHIEYISGIANPIGMKVGPGTDPHLLLELVNRVNPENEPGRLTLITRFGASNIEESLPPLIEIMQKNKKNLLWSSDPMHGNTQNTEQGYKTRSFNDILSELQSAFKIHSQLGSHLGGVHFELTGEDVTECIGGARGLTESDLQRAYKSLVDPRLNYEQALEMAMLVVKNVKNAYALN